MKKLLFTLIFALLGAVTVSAQYSITMKLKDGSELYGYIAEQIPGKKFVFNATKSYMYLDGKDVLSASPKTVEYKDLPENWQKWATENSAYDGGLVLYDICLRDRTIGNVRLLEKGTTYRYLSCEVTDYELDWDQIEMVEGGLRPKSLLSGIDRIYKLSDGRQIQGQYVKEIPGETIGLYTESGIIEIFESGKIVKESKVHINPEQSMIEQSELLDVLTLNGGATVEGIILERNYSKNSEEEYLLIIQKGNLTQSLRLSDIQKYGKKPNPDYKPEYDIEIAKGELALSGKVVPEIKDVQRSEEGLSVISDTVSVKISRADAVKTRIEARFDNEESARSLKIVAAKMEKKSVKSGKDKYEVLKYSVNYAEMVNMAVQCQSLSVSRNGIYKMMFSLPYEGVYFIYNTLDKTVRLIEVTQ